jgi:hypothetical protein
MEKWNEICFLISQHKNNNIKEDYFQLEIEHLFELLGWSRYKEEIITKRRIKIGAANALIPDIIICDSNNDVIAVELKRPDSFLEKNRDQLFSYMRQCKVKFGLLIGEKLQFFYETPFDTKSPKLILEAEFTKNNPNGNDFIELFSKHLFNEDKVIKFCNEKLDLIEVQKKEQDEINFLKSEDGKEYILALIGNDLLKKYNEEIIDKIIDKISIDVKEETDHDVSLNTTQQITLESISKALPIEYYPSNMDEFKSDFLEKGLAYLYYYYADGRIEEKVWKRGRFNENSSLVANIRSRPEARRGKWKDLGISKLIVQIEK